MSGDQLPVGGSFLWEPTGSVSVMTPERFTSEQLQIAQAGRQFSEDEILPRVREIEARTPGLMPDLLRKAGDRGLLMVDVPEAYGGLGLDTTTSMLLAEQFSRVGSFSVSLGAHTGIGTLPIVYFGNEEQKRAYLPDLATGKRLAAYALTEPSSGSDALAARTKATLTADGARWRLDGSKQFITNAGFADVFVVFAKVDGRDFTAFLVDRATRGVTVGAEEHKMGIRGSSTCALAFEGAEIPRDRVLGEIGKGHKIAFNTLNLGRIKLGVGTIGGAKFALSVATQYALERKQFGRAIGTFGLIADKLAEMAIRAFAGESMGYRTTGLVDDRLRAARTDTERVDAIEEFTIESSIIKVFGSEVLDFCADEAVQIHGGYGFIEDFHPERLLRDSRINRIFEGTNEINRLIVPGTLLRRAMKGGNPLLATATAIRTRLRDRDLPPAGSDSLGIGRHIAELAKWASIYALSVAAETFRVKVADEQEILGGIADMIIHSYAIDSVVARAAALREPLIDDVVAAFVPRAFDAILQTGRHVVSDIADEKSVSDHLAALDHLRVAYPVGVLAAKRRIATAVREAGGYPFDRHA